MAAAPLVWINGFPGSGKLTVATQLQVLHSGTILIDNHKLIDPVEENYARDHPGYPIERHRVRAQAFDDYAGQSDKLFHLLVFTGMLLPTSPLASVLTLFSDFQSSNDLGHSTAMEYKTAAERAGRPFKPVYLICDQTENARRIVSHERHGTKKLLDPELLQAFYTRCQLYEFVDTKGLTLDVTCMSPRDAASRILSFAYED